MAVLDGYLSGPLYHRAAYAAQQLLALTEMMAWREGTHVAHTLHLAELIAAFSREVVQAATGQTPTRGCDAAGAGGPDVPPAA